MTSKDPYEALFDEAISLLTNLDLLKDFITDPDIRVVLSGQDLIDRTRTSAMDLLIELMCRVRSAETERDVLRDQLEKIGRKSFWAARQASKT